MSKAYFECLVGRREILLEDEHINSPKNIKRQRAHYSVLVGQGHINGASVVFYYGEDLNGVGWSFANEDAYMIAFEAADLSILSADKNRIIKLGLNHDYSNAGRILMMCDCAGGPMTAPCFIILTRLHDKPKGREYAIHTYNAETNGYMFGHYDMPLTQAIPLFNQKMGSEMTSAKDQGLPEIRLWMNGYWVTTDKR